MVGKVRTVPQPPLRPPHPATLKPTEDLTTIDRNESHEPYVSRNSRAHGASYQFVRGGGRVSVGLARVTISAPNRRVDVALPEHVPLAELLPEVLRHAGEGLADDGEKHGGGGGRRAPGGARAAPP